ncbi:MAG TPA: hypothetical protein PLN96_02550 [Zoogloea sp.]|uniref:hypothetical protein n=1 Tax=Zoogloea sp. TaxID=49181 RepID=UPI002C39F383|nr:hypothetical protein [Zoogloea sp.]HMV17444.1 hypothetical protein [Rhodocyclaceae bacterium]HMV62333.1 hypothetical protein [Rhodocyclaceae bacterium]HMY48543.1 hypothetical protein [Rhodocyclaceae bacterium]HMZ76647.1 hypothetical protein [Rhodocyclaceae bacterium]HNA67398.1 hypothetical protein [Rhodocyclaceae bacterium]
MKRRIGIGLAAALLVTCPTTWATEAQSIEIKVEDIASLKKYPKVALIGYAIEQQNFLVKMSTSWGSTSSSTSEVTLEGVSTPAMQAATDRLYADLVKRLEAAGLEVVKLDEVRNDPMFADLKGDKPQPSPSETSFVFDKSKGFKNSKALVFSPSGLPWHIPSAHEEAARFGAGDKMSANLSRAFSGKQPVADVENALAKARGITLLKAYYVVGFGRAGGRVSEMTSFNYVSNRSEKTISAAANATAELYLDKTDTRLALRVPGETPMLRMRNNSSPAADGSGFIRLDKKLSAGADFAVGEPKNANSTETQVGNALSTTLAVVGGLAGIRGVGSASTQEFVVTANEQRYVDTVEALIQTVQAEFVDRLAAAAK